MKKAQMKIQEMAFVLVGIMVFFGMVALLYVTIRMSGLKQDVSTLQEDEAREVVRRLASTAEFAWTASDCSNCIDLDKVMALKGRQEYKGFWGLDYLKIEKVYPTASGECTLGNYPSCQSITLIDKEAFGTPPSAFVSLCRYDFKDSQSYVRCDIGKIYATKRLGK